ncbi:MAG: hypothetical protein IJD28_03000 [Deferribacterales bacterium]|nr:hypothetical protein [Deferribacterales bacterium]
MGTQRGANIATLAAANALGGFVSEESLTKSVLSMIPKGTEELNKAAFQIGLELARAAKNG